LPWNDAAAACHHLSGELVSVQNEAEWEALQNFIMATGGGAQIWTAGLRVSDTNFVWDNAAGGDVDSSLFLTGQPDNPGTEGCFCLRNFNKFGPELEPHRLNDSACGVALPYICVYQQVPEPETETPVEPTTESPVPEPDCNVECVLPWDQDEYHPDRERGEWLSG